MTPLRWTYLGLALWGAILPMWHFVAFMRAEGTGLLGMFEAWFVNRSTQGLVWDLTIAAFALIVWVIAEVRVRRNWDALLAIPATLCIGLSCGLPLYLLLRSRPIR